jgi:phosphoglycolate phosphatase
MRPTIALFDIDGTLVKSDGVGRRSISRAFEREFGRADACDDFRFDGLTDRLIAKRGLAAIAVPGSEDNVQRLFAAYLEILEQEVGCARPDQYRLQPGIERAVLRARSANVAVGLGAGNLREGARIKLSRLGIYRHFDFGGFGCDAEDRVELVRRGAERGAAWLGRPLAECRVVVIGDTPHDVRAAQGIGAECIGVGTGAYSAADLLATGATQAFDDFGDERALPALLGA